MGSLPELVPWSVQLMAQASVTEKERLKEKLLETASEAELVQASVWK